MEANEVNGIWPDDNVILFDGVCVFCSRWVRFVVARDKPACFRFTPIQSPYGTRLAQALGIDADDPDTNAVIQAAWHISSPTAR
jgi:predicted DCC family thiol-disulfide oxidoreductase YuxK